MKTRFSKWAELEKIGILTTVYSMVQKGVHRMGHPGVGTGRTVAQKKPNETSARNRDASGSFIWDKDFTVESKADVLLLMGYRYITGDLKISGSAIENLEGLESLAYVGGDLSIVDTSVSDLDGLSGLVSVSGCLRIEGNRNLREMDGVAGFAKIVGDAFADQTASVRFNDLAPLDVGGFSRLASVGGDLYIGNNPVLQNLKGFTALASVEASVFIWGNDALENLTGLSKLKTIGGHLELWSNPSLRNLRGLGGLVSIGRDLSIGLDDFGNDGLKGLDSLRSLRSIGGNLTVRCNPSLVNLKGLLNLASIRGARVHIADNNRLPTSELETIQDHLMSAEFSGEVVFDCRDEVMA